MSKVTKDGRISLDIALKELERLNDEVTELKAKLIKQKPLVNFAEHIAKSSGYMSFDDFVSLLNSQGIPIQKHKFNLWLKDNGFMSLQSGVYQKFIDKGYFVNERKVTATPYGEFVDIETYITGKGQIYFHKKLSAVFKLKTQITKA